MGDDAVQAWPVLLDDGSMVAVFAPPLKNHRRVEAVYGLLTEQVAVLGVDPIALEAIRESDETVFFEALSPWYDMVLKELKCGFRSKEMDWRSRYTFFLAGPRVKWQDYELPDLSGLSKLLGYVRSEAKQATSPPKHTTGEPALDAWVAVALCFKKQHRIFLDLPLADAVKATSMAGAIYAEQQAEMDKKYSTDKKEGVRPQLRQPSNDKEVITLPAESQEVVEELRSSGFSFPDGL